MSQSAKGGGIGLCGALFIAFVVLRLTDHIDWEWYWVASPLWIPLAIAIPFAVVAWRIVAGESRRGRDDQFWS